MKRAYSGRTQSIVHSLLTRYLLLTFGIAWVLWSPLLAAEYMGLPLPLPAIVFITLGTFVPSMTALFLTWRNAGTTELRHLLSQALVWRVSPFWYVLAIFGPALVMLLAMGGHIVLVGVVPDYVPFGFRWLIVPVNFVLVLLIGGPLGEEFGWRGVVLPALEARFKPPWASLLKIIPEATGSTRPLLLAALLTWAVALLVVTGRKGEAHSRPR